MLKQIASIIRLTLLILVVLGQPYSASIASAGSNLHHDDGFVKRHGNILKLDGRQFRFAG